MFKWKLFTVKEYEGSSATILHILLSIFIAAASLPKSRLYSAVASRPYASTAGSVRYHGFNTGDKPIETERVTNEQVRKNRRHPGRRNVSFTSIPIFLLTNNGNLCLDGCQSHMPKGLWTCYIFCEGILSRGGGGNVKSLLLPYESG